MIKQLYSDIVIYGVANAIRSLVPFIMLPLLTAYLGADSFGILSLIEMSILFLFPFISLNIFSAINIEYFKADKEVLQRYVSNALLLSGFSFILFFFFASIIYAFFRDLLSIPAWLIFMLPVFAGFRVLVQVYLGILHASRRAKKYLFMIIIQTIVDFLLSYVFVVTLLEDYLGRLWGIYIAFLLISMYSLFSLKKEGYLDEFTLKYSQKILNFTLPLIPHVVGGIVIAMSDRYFISYFINNEILGYYTVSYQIASLMLLFSVSINQAWSPYLFRLLKEKVKMRIVLKYVLSLMLLFLFIGLVIFLSEGILFRIFVNENFYEAKEYFLWLLVGFIFQSLYFLITKFLFYAEKTKLLASFTFAGAILNLNLNYFFIQSFGAIGVAYATALTWFVFFFAVASATFSIYRKL